MSQPPTEPVPAPADPQPVLVDMPCPVCGNHLIKDVGDPCTTQEPPTPPAPAPDPQPTT